MSQPIPIIFVGRVPDIALGIIEEMKPEIEGIQVFSSLYYLFGHGIVVYVLKLLC